MARFYVVNEVRYFYLGLAARGQRNGAVPTAEVDGLLREALGAFNARRIQRYNLRRRSFAYTVTPRLILYELRDFGLVELHGPEATGTWTLSLDGWRLYHMLRQPSNRLVLREEFARLFCDTFPVFRGFLAALAARPPNAPVGIPLLSPSEFDRFDPDDRTAAVAHAATMALDLLVPRVPLAPEVPAALRMALEAALARRPAEQPSVGAALQQALAKFFIQHFFPGLVGNKTYYDLVRTRSAFVGLTNFFREGRPRAAVEIVYPIAQLATAPDAPAGWHSLQLKNGHLWLRAPDWTSFAPAFLTALQRAYTAMRRSIGYAEVADLRDQVCFDLGLPDHLFDDLLQRAVQESQSGTLPLRIYLDSSLGDTMPSPKRAPLELRDRAFNLVRVQPNPTTEGDTNHG